MLSTTVRLYLSGISWGPYDAARVGGTSSISRIVFTGEAVGASDRYVVNSGSCSVDANTGEVTALTGDPLESCSVTVTVTKSGYATRTHTYTVVILPDNTLN